MTVYVTQRPKPNTKGWEPNLTSAHQYGKIEFIFEADEKIFVLPGPSLFKARRVMRDFNFDTDFILHPSMTDPMAQAVVLAGLFKEVNAELIPHINFLYFDRKRDENGMRTVEGGVYYPIKMVMRKD